MFGPGLSRRRALALAAASAAVARSGAAQTPGEPGHGIAYFGDLDYPRDFPHFESIEPAAPKGGGTLLGTSGSFDTLNPYAVKGTPEAMIDLVNGTLMASSDREPFAYYAAIARSVTLPADRSWVEFDLDPRARFNDGTAITAADVLFSVETLREKGKPYYRNTLKEVGKAETGGPHRIRFAIENPENREIPMVLAGQIPVLPRAFWEKRDFEKPLLDPPPGAGGYRIERLEPGRSAAYRRVENHWAERLPTAIGYGNFDRVGVTYYRDDTVLLEAFKAGDFDYRGENVARNWAAAYDIEAVREGRLVKREIKRRIPNGMQGFVLNTRRWPFQDWRVRRAFAFAFDFEWTNKNILFGQYTRCTSYFNNSDMAATGLPEGAELAVLAPLRDQLPAQVFSEPPSVPTTSGDGDIRGNLRAAFALLAAAGFEVSDFELRDKESGRPIRVEILLDDSTFERLALPYIRNLRRLGIRASVRTVEPSQYVERVRRFDFDTIVASYYAADIPGNELADMWSSKAADQDDSQNYVGLKDKAVDALIDLVLKSNNRAELTARVKALDRVLLHRHLAVPQYYIDYDRVLHWNKFGLPKGNLRVGIPFMSWWVDPAKARALRDRIRSESVD